MVIRYGGKSHGVVVWWIQAVQLKICDSHLTRKVANKCLNVRERVEVVVWNKRRSPPFPCCPVSRQWPWKKTLIEKIYIYIFQCYFFLTFSLFCLEQLSMAASVILKHEMQYWNLWRDRMAEIKNRQFFKTVTMNFIFC